MAQSKDSLWGGRFAGGPSEALEALSKSTDFDWRLATYDLRGTSAHLVALHAGGYLTKDELAVLNKAVAALTKRVEDGSFVPKATEEDVHAALERGLIQIAGAQLAGKIRAGRSRNDQIATLIRIFMLDAADAIEAQLLSYLDAMQPGRESHRRRNARQDTLPAGAAGFALTPLAGTCLATGSKPSAPRGLAEKSESFGLRCRRFGGKHFGPRSKTCC